MVWARVAPIGGMDKKGWTQWHDRWHAIDVAMGDNRHAGRPQSMARLPARRSALAGNRCGAWGQSTRRVGARGAGGGGNRSQTHSKHPHDWGQDARRLGASDALLTGNRCGGWGQGAGRLRARVGLLGGRNARSARTHASIACKGRTGWGQGTRRLGVGGEAVASRRRGGDRERAGGRRGADWLELTRGAGAWRRGLREGPRTRAGIPRQRRRSDRRRRRTRLDTRRPQARGCACRVGTSRP